MPQGSGGGKKAQDQTEDAGTQADAAGKTSHIAFFKPFFAYFVSADRSSAFASHTSVLPLFPFIYLILLISFLCFERPVQGGERSSCAGRGSEPSERYE